MKRKATFVIQALAIGAFSLASWASSQDVNVQYDELTDLKISSTLRVDPLVGSGDDPSQCRLPMYATALATAIMGSENLEESLRISRILSITVGVIAILLTSVLARRWFGEIAALMSTVLLSASPYFLGFSRMAMTEGDAFCPAAVLATLMTFDSYCRNRSTRGLVLFSLALGVAISTKFIIISIVLPLFIISFNNEHTRSKKEISETSVLTLKSWKFISLIWVIFLVVSAVTIASQTKKSDDIYLVPQLEFLGWLESLILCTLIIIKLFIFDPFVLKSNFTYLKWPVPASWFAIFPLTLVYFLVLFPAHLLNPRILKGLFDRTSSWDGTSPWDGIGEAARLYGGIVLFKLGLPLGLLSLLALSWAALRSRCDASLRLLTLTIATFITVLIFLPARQTFYMMSIYPLLILTLPPFVLHITSMLNSKSIKVAWTIIIITCFGYLIRGDIEVFPTFGFFGYETIGSSWFGHATRGYRSLIQVTDDGTEEALEWCNEHATTKDRVVFCPFDLHIVEDFVFRHSKSIKYKITTNANQNDITYFIFHHARGLDYHELLPDVQTLSSLRLAHVVSRGRGRYRMPIVSIYRKADLEDLPVNRGPKP
jgi:hypothetical protein